MSRPVILLVEDDAWLAGLEAEVLEAAGYTVVYAPHAQAAISRLDETMPDAIVLDMLLTGATAMVLLHELQSYEDSRHIPVILCTNLADSITLESVRPYGVRRILDKTTMAPDELVAALKVVL